MQTVKCDLIYAVFKQINLWVCPLAFSIQNLNLSMLFPTKKIQWGMYENEDYILNSRNIQQSSVLLTVLYFVYNLKML